MQRLRDKAAAAHDALAASALADGLSVWVEGGRGNVSTAGAHDLDWQEGGRWPRPQWGVEELETAGFKRVCAKWLAKYPKLKVPGAAAEDGEEAVALSDVTLTAESDDALLTA